MNPLAQSPRRSRMLACIGLLAACHPYGTSAVGEPLTFRVAFDPALQPAPYTGRVLVVVTQNLTGEPRRAIRDWFNPPQVFAVDVVKHDPAAPVTLDDKALSNPGKLADLEADEYRVQAIVRRSLDDPVPGWGKGDLYSEPATVTIDPSAGGVVELRLTQVYEPRPFSETDSVKLVEMKSDLLSKFHGRDIIMRAAVCLPGGWTEDGDQKYPVIYHVPGFGGDHRMAFGLARFGAAFGGDKVLQVALDATCHRGHHVFADSANNGPWATALVTEFIPYIEKRFRGAGAEHRHVTGISSGGWSSLWLQITHPDAFAACWSHVPDPVDFRAFQLIDLYREGANMYRDDKGERRPIARNGQAIMGYYDDFVHAEDILGPGGQMLSSLALHSARPTAATPAPMFNHATGAVDAEVAHTWDKYDIRLVLERNWKTLGPKLAGKLHIYAGGLDNFYLDGAVRLLDKSLKELGSDAVVVIEETQAHAPNRAGLQAMYQAAMGGQAPAEPPTATKTPAPESEPSLP